MAENLRDKLARRMSRPMAVRVLRALKAIISEAQRRGLVAQNVALGVKISRKDRERPKPKIPTKTELAEILTASASSEQPMVHPLACLLVFAGLRASELRGLAWAELDLKNGTVTVSQRADAAGNIGPPKSKASFRSIPLPKMAVKALKRWKLACPPGDLVFPSPTGKVMSHPYMARTLMGPPQIASKIVKPGLSSTPRFGLHAFRHAAASLWIDQRVNAKRVQVWMGHGSIQVTFDTYGHLFEQVDQDNEIANAVERSIFADAT
ncbi:tyrosine-type recombinase/integrase [Parasphingorhabdus litoris]|nr:site-specific integrase [Parasphingorhabdus litoris]